jgi:DNA-binding transcriptional LysR family regulator
VAQPAISQAIKKLDDELGVRLFDRVGRNIRLSETGKLFYKEIEPLVKALDDIPQKLANEVGLENKTIKVNILAGHELMTNIISDFQRLNPDSSFQLSQEDDDTNWDIRISSLFVENNANMEETVLSEEIYIAVPQSTHYADMDSLSFSDIKHAGFVSLEKSRQFSSVMASHCLSSGFEPLIVFEAESPEMLARLVGSGVGIAFWPSYSWGPLKDDRVKLKKISGGSCSWNLYLTRKDQAHKTELKDAFYSYTVKRIRELEFK